jgi:hypothetical protein
MSSCKRLCSFQSEWVKQEQFCEWLKPVLNNKHRASCTLCKKSFDIGNMGSSALLSHKLTFLAKSNALRKGAKSKRTEITELDDIISKHAVA